MPGRPALARGDVVLVRFPFSDLHATTVRPAVVIGRVRGDDLLLAFVTSRDASFNSPSEVALDPGDSEFARTGLRVPSRIRLDRIMTLERSLVFRRLGTTGERTRARIGQALRYVFEV